ncbi:hypothetical protein OF83DRAFT_1084412 [Amylostereum chailletii]|nr:hypothetical protein OF83DRAFT_1084412 [Amylostereum chailletii]
MYKHTAIRSNRSLQLDMNAVEPNERPALLYVNPLSPIYEVHSPSSSRRPQSDVEPPTPASVGSNYSAFLKRPLRRSISQASASSSLGTSASAPVLPPINLSPVELRTPFSGAPRPAPQPISTVYEDGASERTGSFVTAHTSDEASTPAPREQELDTDPEATLATTTGSRDSFIWRRWRRGLSFGSHRPSILSSLHLPNITPPRAAILFWVGFIAPWCWLIGGWLVEEGRPSGVREPEKEDGPVLPVWRVPAAEGAQQEVESAAPRQSNRWTQWLAVGGGASEGEDFKLLGRREAQAWVVRCRIAAVVSGALLVAGFIVALVLADHLH